MCTSTKHVSCCCRAPLFSQGSRILTDNHRPAKSALYQHDSTRGMDHRLANTCGLNTSANACQALSASQVTQSPSACRGQASRTATGGPAWHHQRGEAGQCLLRSSLLTADNSGHVARRGCAVPRSPPMTHLQNCACDSGAPLLHETINEAWILTCMAISAVSHGSLTVSTCTTSTVASWATTQEPPIVAVRLRGV